MSAISATTIKYGTPLVAKVGDLLLTATQIEIPATEEEYVEGGFELKPAKLGLTDEAVSGAASVAREAEVGETASTTQLPALVWSSGLIVEAKTENESAKQVKKAWPINVSSTKGKILVRLFDVKETNTTGQEWVEQLTATKVKLGLCTTTIYALGK